MTPNYQRTDTIFLMGIPVYTFITYICFKASTQESSNMLELKLVGHSEHFFLMRERELQYRVAMPEPMELKRPNLGGRKIAKEVSYII